jgi:hypothetical protein
MRITSSTYPPGMLAISRSLFTREGLASGIGRWRISVSSSVGLVNRSTDFRGSNRVRKMDAGSVDAPESRLRRKPKPFNFVDSKSYDRLTFSEHWRR